MQHNPRAYWSSETGYFNMVHFLTDITEGRVSFDEIIDAHPSNVTQCFSAVLVNPA